MSWEEKTDTEDICYAMQINNFASMYRSEVLCSFLWPSKQEETFLFLLRRGSKIRVGLRDDSIRMSLSFRKSAYKTGKTLHANGKRDIPRVVAVSAAMHWREARPIRNREAGKEAPDIGWR